VKQILIILLAIFLIACGQQHYPLERYIQNPSKSDTTCIADINRAKTMVENGKIVFCYPFYFGSSNLRQENQLRLLCEQYNLTFNYEVFSCFFDTKQQEGCFSAYMDKVISDKFGSDFKQKLLSQADSMMIAANDTVPYYLCDKKPKILGAKDNYESEYLTARAPEELQSFEKQNLPVRIKTAYNKNKRYSFPHNSIFLQY